MKPLIEKDGNSINYKILLFITICSVFFFLALNAFKEYAPVILDVLYFVVPLIISLFSFFIAKLYWDSEIFGRSYFALGIAFFSLVLREIIWHIYTLTKIWQLEYVIQGFYFIFYLFLIYHLLKNIQYFLPIDTSKIRIFFLILLPQIVLVGIFSNIYFVKQFLILEILEIHLSVLILELAILGMIIFKNNILNTTWVVILLGLFLDTLANIWQSYEFVVFSKEFDFVHVYNMLWIASFMMIVYALFKHKKAL